MTIDPITLEILNNKVSAAAEEMSYTLQRTGRTLFVKETADFATAIADLNGKFFGYPRAIGVSNYMDLDCMPAIRAFDDLAPGDVIMTNHPFESEGLATHLPDLHMIQPYFHNGRIVAYGWCFIHCSDVGGRVPSSISPANTEIHQEGLLIPPVKIMEGGKENRDFLRIFRANSRTPHDNAGDIKAMVASLATGEQRVAELIAQHGVEDFIESQEALQAYSAAKARAVLRRIPDGSYEFIDYLDDDFNSTVPLRLKVRMTVSDGLVHLDYSGTDGQVASAYNIPTGGKRHPWLTLRLIAFILTYDPTVAINAGLYRNFSVKTEEGSIVNPVYPAAVGVRHATATRVNDVLNGVLAKAVPELMKAPSGGVTVPVVFTEPDAATGGRKVLVLEPLVGGSGARAGADGVDGRDSGIANLANNPIESVESNASVRVKSWALRMGSGGAGQWRGGLGLTLTFEILADDCQVLGRGTERFRFAPWGMKGGHEGALFQVILEKADGSIVDVGKLDVLDVNRGDIVSIHTPGGGGYGDPFKRDAVTVADDVRRGFITLEQAAQDYGVALSATLDVDQDATAALRAAHPGRSAEFIFGEERDSWEALFTDTHVTELNELLSKLPMGARQKRRAAIYADVLDGVPRAGTTPLAERIAAVGDAPKRLEKALVALRDEVGESPSGVSAAA
ncbi:hydantoinase [Falsochrobactrum shanghaiense]|uniref:Hydantoinase n=1 Tax=Falsochrobactrum shanghaiense TaxID=2201899 RepID=A0A316JFX6_9HYPH|nr:hydantoinase B/oxoprolinase family protein [Falsochrobactrum shanghaiense]PWL19485.1 hydantoinase [Falsochrobactrum shanghaiense]